jgi:hypothetical protein
MLKFRSDSCLSKQNKSASKFKINICLGHEKCLTYLKFTKMNVWDDDTKSMYTYLPSNPLSSGHTRKLSLSPSFPWTPVGTRISLRCRYALWFSFRNEGHDPDLVFHRLTGYSIGFFLKPIMKRWQVLHMHNFCILINRVSLRKDLGYNSKKCSC